MSTQESMNSSTGKDSMKDSSMHLRSRSACLRTALGLSLGAASLLVICALSPRVASAQGQSVAQGGGGLPVVAVYWNGFYRTTTLISPTQISFDLPAADLASSGSGSVTVANPGSTPSTPVLITVN